MESSTIIKLRQAESRDIDTNGSYKVSLKENVLLEKGDIAKIHTAIIDTTAESVVELPTKTRITMGIGKYIRNFFLPDATATPSWYNYGVTPSITAVPDLETPISFVSTVDATGVDDFNVTQIAVMSRSQDILRNFGDITLLFEYIPIGGTENRICKVIVPPLPIIKHLEKPVMINVGQIIRTKLFKCVNTAKDLRDSRIFLPFSTRTTPGVQPYVPSSIEQDSFIVYGNNGNPLPSGTAVINPFEENLIFDLDAGTYTPQELTTIISDKMADLQSGGIIGDIVDVPSSLAYPVNSPILRTIYDISDRIGALTGSPEFILTPESTKDKPVPAFYLTPVIEGTITSRTTALNLLVGSNEVSLSFDESLQKLIFNILHFPLYKAVGGASEKTPAILYSSGLDNKGDALPILPQVSGGGIFFTRLTSQEVITNPDFTESVGEYTSFWNQLGFDDIVVTQSHDTLNPIDPSGTPIVPCSIKFEVGKHITGVFLSLDSIVDKSTAGSPLVPTTGGAETSLTKGIISNREFNNVVNDEGYYLVEIGMNLPQKMIGGATNENTTSNKLQSIVGKYFSQNGNFLQDDGAGSIVYQHQSDVPQLLSEFTVRILHADQTPPEPHELGVHNSIFLEIIKSTDQ